MMPCNILLNRPRKVFLNLHIEENVLNFFFAPSHLKLFDDVVFMRKSVDTLFASVEMILQFKKPSPKEAPFEFWNL